MRKECFIKFIRNIPNCKLLQIKNFMDKNY